MTATPLTARPNKTAQRVPGDFARHPKSSAPYVSHPTRRSTPKGTKTELLAQCETAGIVPPAKATNAALIELLKNVDGGTPTRVQYGRPSSFGKQIENSTNLQKWAERAVALGIILALQERAT